MAGQWQDPYQQGQGGPPQWEPHVQPHVQNSPPQGNYQPQWQPQYPPPPQSPYPPPRKSRKGVFGIGCLGLIGLIVLVSALASHTSSSAPPAALPTLPTVAVSQQAAPASSAAAKAVTVAKFTGSGTQSTAKFTVTASWEVKYSFDCTSFDGQPGNFIIMEDGGFTGAMDVNQLALKKAGTSYAYDDAGTHYLKVTSECSWAVDVISLGS